jgi:hypothetical protein
MPAFCAETPIHAQPAIGPSKVGFDVPVELPLPVLPVFNSMSPITNISDLMKRDNLIAKMNFMIVIAWPHAAQRNADAVIIFGDLSSSHSAEK